MQSMVCARARALLNAGNSRLASIAMIAITTSNSIKVKPRRSKRSSSVNFLQGIQEGLLYVFIAVWDWEDAITTKRVRHEETFQVLKFHADAVIGWNRDNNGVRFGIGHTTGGLYFFRTTSDPGTITNAA